MGHEYLPAVPRAIWLDTDTIVNADLRTLYRMRMRYALAATHAWMADRGDGTSEHLTLAHWTIPPDVLIESGFDPSVKMFQTGVLLVDLNKWRVSVNITRSINH